MNDRFVTLSIETATRLGSVCLSQGDEVLASIAGEAVGSHSNTLLKQIQDVLGAAQKMLAEIDLFAVASGPGSFTGLRIGLATIKGLAATLGRPCIGIPTLHAVARSGGVSPSTVALLPAGRGEVFAQMFAVTEEDTIVELDQPTHSPLSDLLPRYSIHSNIVWCGEAAETYREAIVRWAEDRRLRFAESAENPNHNARWSFAPPERVLARHVAALAQLRIKRGDKGDPNSLRALYVRPSDAELNSNVHHAPGY
ncbi:MAG TPA: tRNA (adenosine(37)-N6)-threonylcarbamoyltransferase complex dimerization subunit type 1 TsaB [Pyrinomonadaceae bacterium]